MRDSCGFLVAVEGMDGSGKSSITKLLVEQLRSLNFREIVPTREIGGTPIAEQLRALSFKKNPSEELDPVSRLLMVLAARNQHYRTVIEPAISAGKIVVTDRYNPSTIVLQQKVDGLESELNQLHSLPVLEHIVRPALLHVYLHVDGKKAFERGIARTNVDNDAYKNDEQKAIKTGAAYRELFSPSDDPHEVAAAGSVYKPTRLPGSLAYCLDVNSFDDIENRVRMVAYWVRSMALNIPYRNFLLGKKAELISEQQLII